MKVIADGFTFIFNNGAFRAAKLNELNETLMEKESKIKSPSTSWL